MSFREEEDMLERFGCRGIEYDNLVNNYYIKFIYKRKKFIIEHILNAYGEEVDYWELFGRTSKTFGTLEELLNYIK